MSGRSGSKVAPEPLHGLGCWSGIHLGPGIGRMATPGHGQGPMRASRAAAQPCDHVGASAEGQRGRPPDVRDMHAAGPRVSLRLGLRDALKSPRRDLWSRAWAVRGPRCLRGLPGWGPMASGFQRWFRAGSRWVGIQEFLAREWAKSGSRRLPPKPLRRAVPVDPGCPRDSCGAAAEQATRLEPTAALGSQPAEPPSRHSGAGKACQGPSTRRAIPGRRWMGSLGWGASPTIHSTRQPN